MPYRTKSGKAITLGAKVNSGGEATVFQTSTNGMVAKIYNVLPDQDKVMKLRGMISSNFHHPVIAWPKDLLFENDDCIGYLMPYFKGVPLHRIINPKSQQSLPKEFHIDANFMFSIALNLCRIVDFVHQKNIVIGDLNESNFLVTHRAEIILLDADSFQYKQWLCGVGRLDYTAPELHGSDFTVTKRTTCSDNFSLALLVYQIIAVGKHPYLGKWPGAVNNSIQNRIKLGISPLLGTAQPTQITPDLSKMPNVILQLFKRSLASKSIRPTAKDYENTLLNVANDVETSINHYRYAIGLKNSTSKNKPSRIKSSQVTTHSSLGGSNCNTKTNIAKAIPKASLLVTAIAISFIIAFLFYNDSKKPIPSPLSEKSIILHEYINDKADAHTINKATPDASKKLYNHQSELDKFCQLFDCSDLQDQSTKEKENLLLQLDKIFAEENNKEKK